MADPSLLEDNPLSKNFVFPPYHLVKPKHVRPGISELVRHLEDEMLELEHTVQLKCPKIVERVWSEVVEPLERILDKLEVVWGVVEHLKEVKGTPEFLSAFKEVQIKVVEFQMRVKQSKPINDIFVYIKGSSNFDKLSEARKRIVQSWITTAILSGVDLDDHNRAKLVTIEKNLKQLSLKFEENVRDATKKFEKLITDKKETKGLSPAILLSAAKIAKFKGHENATVDNGPWMITLEDSISSYVISNSENGKLRSEVNHALLSLASSGDHDNTPIMEAILKLRFEKAKLLKYENYAEVSMKNKMATLVEAKELMDKLRMAYYDLAVEEMKALKKFCTKSCSNEEDGDLNDLNIAFWRSKLCGEISRSRRSNSCGEPSKSDEEVACEYFSWPTVREGLFNLSKKLFGIDIEPTKDDSVWHPQVEFYRVCDSSPKPIAYFYVDPYARPSQKRGGAWTREVYGRSSAMSRDNGSPRLPVAHLVYNLTPPMGDEPSFLTIEEVVTVFHEFGHALQHMLTKQDEGLVSGMQGIECDAVELPSQFMERWCYDKDTLMSIGKHYDTKENIPESLCKVLLKNVELFRGLDGLQQVRQAILDLQLHSEYIPDGRKTVLDFSESVCQNTSVYHMLQEHRYICSSTHIFTGEYEAGYYGYKWSEMMAVDAFSVFEEAGLNDKEAIKEKGHKFRETILALGGGMPAKEVFKKFRGKEYSSEELLKKIRKPLPEPPRKQKRKREL